METKLNVTLKMILKMAMTIDNQVGASPSESPCSTGGRRPPRYKMYMNHIMIYNLQNTTYTSQLTHTHTDPPIFTSQFLWTIWCFLHKAWMIRQRNENQINCIGCTGFNGSIGCRSKHDQATNSQPGPSVPSAEAHHRWIFRHNLWVVFIMIKIIGNADKNLWMILIKIKIIGNDDHNLWMVLIKIKIIGKWWSKSLSGFAQDKNHWLWSTTNFKWNRWWY